MTYWIGEITPRAKADEQDDEFSGGKTIGLRYCKDFYEAVSEKKASKTVSGSDEELRTEGQDMRHCVLVSSDYHLKCMMQQEMMVIDHVQLYMSRSSEQ